MSATFAPPTVSDVLIALLVWLTANRKLPDTTTPGRSMATTPRASPAMPALVIRKAPLPPVRLTPLEPAPSENETFVAAMPVTTLPSASVERSRERSAVKD